MKFLRILAALAASLMFVVPIHPAVADEPPGQRAVLVTGASSGIGRNIAERLVEEGHYVYAGARKDDDLAELDAIDNVTAVKLDVTKQADIDAAVEFIERQGRGLYGLVNNAGVAIFSPMNETPEQDVHFVMNVNVLGPYRMNKAFAPLLAQSRGRTTTIGSISGFLSGPNSGTYSMSKFAVEAYTEALAAELADTGISVSVIEPGGYRSRIREKVALHSIGKMDSGAELTEEEERLLESRIAANEKLKEPDEVSDAVVEALFSDKPKLRYMVTPNQREAAITIRAALGRAVQLNADQRYEYSRDELVSLLDELLGEVGE
jgi:NAD(P)-dependent dehydrogenase (short-subunit alcohol dehydrogenase family)